MRQIRFYLLVLLLLPVFLTGCGGGGGSSKSVGTRTVTITVRWPAPGQRHAINPRGRANITDVNYILVEAFDGLTPVGRITLVTTGNGSSTATGTMQLPAKPIVFYANGFAAANPASNTDPTVIAVAGYKTLPDTNILAHNDRNPLTNADPHPLAQAATVEDLTTTQSVIFTMNNTIAAIQPVTTSFSLDAGSIGLNTTVKTVASDGATILYAPGVLKWVYDTSDTEAPLQTLRSTLQTATDQNNPDFANPQLKLLATGRVRLIVSDNEVTQVAGVAQQQPISATITYTITPSQTQKSFALNVAAGSQLLATCPLYTNRITCQLIQQPLGYPTYKNGQGQSLLNGQNQPLDTVPQSLPALTQTFVATPTVNPNGTVTGLTLTPKSGSLSYYPTGRPLTLVVKAWSGTDDNGSGALLAEYTTPASQNATTDVALTSHVTGFTFTPANPTYVLTNTNASPSNTHQLQLAVNLDNASVPVPIHPGTAINPGTLPNGTVSFNLQQTDPFGFPYIQFTATAAGSAPLTATDRKNNKSSQTTITVTTHQPGFGIQ